uniref:Retrotransposon gag domain-containing protein n=1 Tax=Tanacetum cinerariifolium TaxID=118510 RepID=A0A6L2JF70_TANCI|nr:hypothetical protein [Tanacetum cinerariifolium]
MRTRSSSNLPVESSPNLTSSNPKRRNHRRSKQPFILEESPVDTMADQRTMAELLRAPTEGYAEVIVVLPILAKQFELKHNLINMMTLDQFFGLKKDNPHDHIRAARRWLEKEPPRSILTWEDLVSKLINEFFPPSRTTNLRNEISNFQQRFDESFHEAWDRYKDLLRACPHHGFIELHQLDTFYNALNPADQDSLNSTAGDNLLERRTQRCVDDYQKQNQAKLTHAVNQQTSDVTTTMTVILKKFQATLPPAFVKAVEEICVTCGGAHPYYQCLAADGNTFSELRDNIQGYVSVVVVNYNQGPLPSNTIANPKGELKVITTRSGIVLDGPSVPIPPLFINPEEDERVEKTLTDKDLAEYTVKVPHPLIQKPKLSSQRNFFVHQRDTLHPNALILIPKYQKMLKALLSNKEKLLELANTPLNENCSAVILKKLHEKLRDAGKFLIPCGFSELKCKALADLVNRAICTPAEIARDVFVLVCKFTFPADSVIVDYESDPRVPLILERPFLQTARALIDVHGKEMILRDGDERLTLNMRHDTSSYSNQPQKELINIINIYDDLCEGFLEDLFATNHQSDNPTFSSHPNLNSPEVNDDIFDPKGDTVLIEKLINLYYTKDLPPPHNINPLSDSTTSSSLNYLLEEFTDELARITFLPGNDDLPFDIGSDLKEIEYLLNHDPIKDMDSILEDSVDEDNLNDNLVDIMPDISSDFFPSPKYDSFFFEDFSEVDALPSTNNEDKVFNPGILIQENLFEVITRVAPDKNVNKIAISHASLIFKDFDPPLSLYELPFHKEVPWSETLLSFSSKNEEIFFKPGILTSKGVHSSLLSELSH